MYTFNVKKWVYCLFLMMCFSPLQLMADEVQKLVVYRTPPEPDNEEPYQSEVSFLLSDTPIIKFPNRSRENEIEEFYDLMEIWTIHGKIELSTFDLENMKIVKEDVSNIVNIANSEALFKWNGDALMIDVTSNSSSIVVYDMAGREILSKSLGVGKHALSLSNLPKGMCIIKMNNETLKIWNR